MVRLIATVSLVLLTFTGTEAQDASDLWESASGFYADGDYQEAADHYHLIESKVVSSELYFNLGNCYYQLDSVAKSILYFEMAIRLNPRDRAARENLELARNLMDDPIPAIEEFFLKRWSNSISGMLPPLGWGLLALAFVWVITWMIVRRVRMGSLRIGDIRFALPVTVLLLCLIFGYVAFKNQTASDYAIVMQSISIRVAPDELSAVTRNVSAGEKVAIIDNLDDYYKVRFVNYEHGWLRKSTVRRI